MITNMEQFRNTLHQLVKMDYGFEAYNWSDDTFRFNFYHLGSCYNAFAIASNYHGNSVYVDWQYAKQNIRAGKYACEIASFILNNPKKREYCLKEINWYSEKAHAVFEAKYSIDTYNHDWNGGND